MKIFAVDGIGDIHIAHRDIVMREVAEKAAVSFSTVTGKNVDEEKYSGHVVKISDDMRYAVIETEAPIEAMQNILLDIGDKLRPCGNGGSLYAKALRNDGGKITICFTSKPESFTRWAEALR